MCIFTVLAAINTCAEFILTGPGAFAQSSFAMDREGLKWVELWSSRRFDCNGYT
jgi:hypothetical protein